MDASSAGFAFLDCAERTHVGRRRERNEDALVAMPDRGVFCLADGMGGERAGDLASQATVRHVREAVAALQESEEILCAEHKVQVIEQAVRSAGQWIRSRVPSGEGVSGSTVVTLVFDGRAAPARAVALHAGDSRLYRMREGVLTQLTRDHSMAEELGVARQRLPPMLRSMVTRAVGIEKEVELARTEVEVHPGDLFLLCSDGLTGMLSDSEIAGWIARNGIQSLDGLADKLIQAANDAGGEDNVSVLLVWVDRIPAWQNRTGERGGHAAE